MYYFCVIGRSFGIGIIARVCATQKEMRRGYVYPRRLN